MALTLAAVALAAGVPIGLLSGRQAWLFFVGQLGIAPVTTIPPLPFAILTTAGLALAVAVAAVPGVSASRARTADVLRAE
jgi:ABC-type dipeptide/oligopeptide/nickel transport system permease subunit